MRRRTRNRKRFSGLVGPRRASVIRSRVILPFPIRSRDVSGNFGAIILARIDREIIRNKCSIDRFEMHGVDVRGGIIFVTF